MSDLTDYNALPGLQSLRTRCEADHGIPHSEFALIRQTNAQSAKLDVIVATTTVCSGARSREQHECVHPIVRKSGSRVVATNPPLHTAYFTGENTSRALR